MIKFKQNKKKIKIYIKVNQIKLNTMIKFKQNKIN